MIASLGLLAALGVQGLELEITSLGTPDDRQRYRAQLVAWLQGGRTGSIPTLGRLTTNPLRILDEHHPGSIGRSLTLLEALVMSAVRFAEVQALLRQLAIPFQVNNRLVRGLDYYGHTAFEIIATSSVLRPPSVAAAVTTAS